MNPAQEFTVCLLKEKIEYYKNMKKCCRYVEDITFFSKMIDSYQDVLQIYLQSIGIK